jgi:hypothetical protein
LPARTTRSAAWTRPTAACSAARSIGGASGGGRTRHAHHVRRAPRRRGAIELAEEPPHLADRGLDLAIVEVQALDREAQLIELVGAGFVAAAALGALVLAHQLAHRGELRQRLGEQAFLVLLDGLAVLVEVATHLAQADLLDLEQVAETDEIPARHRVAQHLGEEQALRVLDAPRDPHLAVAGEQRHLAHLAQVEAHRVGARLGLDNLGRRRRTVPQRPAEDLGHVLAGRARRQIDRRCAIVHHRRWRRVAAALAAPHLSRRPFAHPAPPSRRRTTLFRSANLLRQVSSPRDSARRSSEASTCRSARAPRCSMRTRAILGGAQALRRIPQRPLLERRRRQPRGQCRRQVSR